MVDLIFKPHFQSVIPLPSFALTSYVSRLSQASGGETENKICKIDKMSAKSTRNNGHRQVVEIVQLKKSLECIGVTWHEYEARSISLLGY